MRHEVRARSGCHSTGITYVTPGAPYTAGCVQHSSQTGAIPYHTVTMKTNETLCMAQSTFGEVAQCFNVSHSPMILMSPHVISIRDHCIYVYNRLKESVQGFRSPYRVLHLRATSCGLLKPGVYSFSQW